MGINDIIMYAMAFGAALGGLDNMLGSRFGFGDKFDNAFRLLGPIGLSMAGIICLAPLLSSVLGEIVAPLCGWLGIDPGIFGSILAIDMGGYQLALDLAEDAAIGRFAGIIVSSIFGCTIVFTIPVGLAAIDGSDRPFFTRGILLGFIAMPAAILTGGMMMGLSLMSILRNCLPVLLISAVLAVGMLLIPNLMMRLFRIFAKLVQIIATAGLTIAAIKYISGMEILAGMPPLMDAMEVVCSIAIVMLGSMPLAELIQRLMQIPFNWVRKKTGLNGVSTTALLLGLVSVTPALAMIPQMDKRGKVVVSASLVCGASAFAAHLAFTMSAQPDLVTALLCAKLLGSILGVVIGLFATRNGV